VPRATKATYDARLNSLEENCPSGNGPGDWQILSIAGEANSLERLAILEHEECQINNGEI